MLKVIAPLMAAFVLGLGTGCTTTYSAPADQHLSGQWKLDKAASDDPDARISAAIAAADTKVRRRLASAGFSQYDPDQPDSGGGNAGGAGRGGRRGGAGGGGSSNGGASTGNGELNGDEFSATGYIGPDFALLRAHLRLVLAAPRALSIDVTPDSVRLAPDDVPASDYPAGDAFTRMDEYGTARIDAKWSGNIFILRARYQNHATLTESYAADGRAGTLTVTRNLTDPVAGKLAVRAVYRR
jgi:hypothetical protein